MNPYLSVVNQRLFFCKLLLQQEKMTDIGLPKLEEALCQSALYQLQGAYSFYLREIAVSYQFRTPETISSVEDLAAALASINKHPAEAQEINGLVENNASWLARMLSAYQQLSSLPEQGEPTDLGRSLGLIDVTQVNDDALNARQLSAWQAALTEMIERHREMMVEC